MKFKFPEKAELIKSINNLNTIDLEKISYDKILSILCNEIKLLPIHRCTIQKNTPIYRARLNNNKLFISEKDILYIPNTEFITKYQRFNEPYQQIFYGSLTLDESAKKKLIENIYYEIVNSTIDKEENDVRLITMGRWEAIEKFEIIDTLFEETNIENLKNENPDKIEEIELIVKFYSNLIKKVNTNNNDYKITAAYSNYAFEQVGAPSCHGIVYHGVKTNLTGRNIALTPFAVNNFLKLKEVKLYIIIRKNNTEPKTVELMFVKELGNNNSSFKWEFNKENIDIINKLF